jgi:hypothetical protein
VSPTPGDCWRNSIRRRGVSVAGALVLALSSAASAAGTDGYRNPTAGADIALQIPGMHRAVVRRDVVYARRDGRLLRLDVYRPAGSTPRARLPGVLLVHGSTSAPSPKNWGIYVGWGQLLAARGLAGVPPTRIPMYPLSTTRLAPCTSLRAGPPPAQAREPGFHGSVRTRRAELVARDHGLRAP